MIRIVYFGLPLAACLLGADGHLPALAILSPSAAPGRRRLRRMLPGHVVDAGEFEDPKALESEIDRRLSGEAFDLLVSWYWTRRVPARVLDRPRLGAVGVHPSLLPRHRGPNPFFAAIDAGDVATGVTVHRLTPTYDEGDVLAQESLEVGERNAWQLARALDKPSLRALRRVVRRLAKGDALEARPQDEAAATWAPEPTGDFLSVDWRWPTERVLRRIRALSPVPGLAIEIRGTNLFVTRASSAEDFPLTLHAGEAALTRRGVVIRTSDGAILLERAQIEDDEADEARELRDAEISVRVGLAGESNAL